MVRAGRGAKEIMILKIEVTGLGDYTRNVGYKTCSITYEFETKTFNYDRGIKLLADVIDVKEAGMGDCFVQVGAELMRTQVASGANAFCFAQIAGHSGVSPVENDLADASGHDVEIAGGAASGARPPRRARRGRDGGRGGRSRPHLARKQVRGARTRTPGHDLHRVHLAHGEMEGAMAVREMPTTFLFDRWNERLGTLPVLESLVHTEELGGEDTIEFDCALAPVKGDRLLWRNLDDGRWPAHASRASPTRRSSRPSRARPWCGSATTSPSWTRSRHQATRKPAGRCAACGPSGTRGAAASRSGTSSARPGPPPAR